MSSKSRDGNPPEVARVAEVIRWAWDQGCPVASPNGQWPDEMVSVALRRWRSVGRRHRKITREIRINDLANGLIAAFESNPKLVGPLKVDYLWLSEQICRVLEVPPPD